MALGQVRGAEPWRKDGGRRIPAEDGLENPLGTTEFLNLIGDDDQAISGRPHLTKIRAGAVRGDAGATRTWVRRTWKAMRIAQTNIQLYNQLRDRGLALDDLLLVHRAYEFLTTLYPGYYQADGKPFVAHGVGVASILAGIDQPGELVAVGLLHNIYGNGDFGDGGGSAVTPFRRDLVREAVGAPVETLLVRFAELRIRPGNVEKIQLGLAELDETDRRLLLVDLADYLEKYVDLGLLYFGESDEILHTTERIGDDLIEIARELGEPRLAEMLSTQIAEVAAQAQKVPIELRASDGRPHLKLVPPRSCRCRLAPAQQPEP
jgi:hypothetical protein